MRYKTAEEEKIALADINMYQGWTAEIMQVLAKMSKLQ